MARPETGTFTDPADPMRTTNMFDSTVIHEMGHASDAQYGWTKKGGPFDTNDDLGAWADHAQDTDALVDRWATDLSLPTTLPVAAELADAVKALKSAMAGKKTNAEDGFKAMATAGGGPAYGTAGDKWQPLWTKISAHTIVQACQMSQSTNNPWRTAPPDINGRTYHDTGYDYWASYKTATRTGGKLSFYLLATSGTSSRRPTRPTTSPRRPIRAAWSRPGTTRSTSGYATTSIAATRRSRGRERAGHPRGLAGGGARRPALRRLALLSHRRSGATPRGQRGRARRRADVGR